MARRRGREDKLRKLGKGRRDLYAGLPSDAEYKRTAHRRAVVGAVKRWLIRLAVLAAVAAAVWLWGDDARRLMRRQVRETEQEFRQAGDHITSGRDRRSGADWGEGE